MKLDFTLNPDVKDLLNTLSQTRRLINSPGMDKSFELVNEYLENSLIIHEYQPGEKAGDWIVPPSWDLEFAQIIQDEKIISTSEDSFLIAAAYSKETNETLSKAELASHMRFHPTILDSFFLEHRYAYDYNLQLKEWGITLPKLTWDKLNNDKPITVEIKPIIDHFRSMKVGEVHIKGEIEETICFTAHIDELCNDNLSSCVVLINLFKNLINSNFKSRYSYKLLLIPETIGTFFYIDRNKDSVTKMKSMINLETVGSGEKWILKETLRKNTYLDKIGELCAEQTFNNYLKVDFFDGYGNEERIFEYPTINIPSICLQRHPYKYYHSSEDKPDKVDFDLLSESFEFCMRLIEILECDYIPVYTQNIPPWLTYHRLYIDSIDDSEKFSKYMNELQFKIDGKTPLSRLASELEIDFIQLHQYLEKFYRKNIIDKICI